MAFKPKKQKAKSVQERRQERFQAELKRKEKAQELDLQEEISELSEDSAVDLEKQLSELEKDYGSEPVGMGMPEMTGPISFEELDAAEAAQEQAQEIQEKSWDVQRLVYNILNHPMLDATEKADAIKAVGTGFEQRVSEILANPPDATEKDLALLEVESVLAHDKRHTGLVESFVDKAVLTTTARKKLSESDFALPSKRKYPIHDKAHVRAALSYAAQEIARGGEAGKDAKEAMPKIRAAAKKFGIEMTMKKDRNAIVIEKDQSGSWRWVGWVSNNFEDTDHDIISKAAHEEFVQWLDEHQEMAPIFLTWHTPETMRKSAPDFWAYENGFLIMSGPLLEKEAEVLLKAATMTDLGMSHGTLVLERDLKDPRVILKYRMYEVSDLPLENAANPFTALETMCKEADMNKLDYLAQFVGKERAEELISQTATAQKDLKEAGVVSKEAETPAPEETAPAPVPVDEVVKEVLERLDLPGLNDFVAKAREAMEKVEVLEAAIKELSVSADEQVAQKIAPPTTLAWSQKEIRPSEKTDNLVKEDEKIGSAPNAGEMWLSKATGTSPIVA